MLRTVRGVRAEAQVNLAPAPSSNTIHNAVAGIVREAASEVMPEVATGSRVRQTTEIST